MHRRLSATHKGASVTHRTLHPRALAMIVTRRTLSHTVARRPRRGSAAEAADTLQLLAGIRPATSGSCV